MPHKITALPARLALGLAVCLGFLASASPAQSPARVPFSSLEEVLHSLTRRAGVIFVGEVVAIQHRDVNGLGAGTVEVSFHVSHAIRNAPADGVYILREWAGLWAGGDQRYHLGQRLLMLLNAPGPSGISSPVAGMTGAIPVVSASEPGSSAAPTVDLRWLRTEVFTPLPASQQTGHRGPLPQPESPAAEPSQSDQPLYLRAYARPAPPRAPTPAATLLEDAPPTLGSVLTLVAAWSKERNEAP